MNIRLQIIIAIILIIALCVIVNMIRKKRLELRYALAWLIVGVGTLVLDCFPILTTKLAELIGVASPINMLFFLGFCFSLVIIFCTYSCDFKSINQNETVDTGIGVV